MSRKGKEKNVTEGSLRNGHHAFLTSRELPYGSSSLYIHALLYILCKCACWFSVQFTQSRSDLTNEVKSGPDKTVSGHTPCLLPALPCHLLQSWVGFCPPRGASLLWTVWTGCRNSYHLRSTHFMPPAMNLSAQTAISMTTWGIYFDSKYSVEVLGSGCPQYLHLSPQWSSYQAPKMCQKSLTVSLIYI